MAGHWPHLWFRKYGDLILRKKEQKCHGDRGVGFRNIHETIQNAILNIVLKILNKCSDIAGMGVRFYLEYSLWE